MLLCEGPKPHNSLTSGFVDPWEPLFMDLNIPNYFKQYKKNVGTFQECIIFENLEFGEITEFEIIDPIRKRRARKMMKIHVTKSRKS